MSGFPGFLKSQWMHATGIVVVHCISALVVVVHHLWILEIGVAWAIWATTHLFGSVTHSFQCAVHGHQLHDAMQLFLRAQVEGNAIECSNPCINTSHILVFKVPDDFIPWNELWPTLPFLD